MNKLSLPLSNLIIHVVTSLLVSTMKWLKLIPLKILMCREPSEVIIPLLLERLLKLPCPELRFVAYQNIE